LADLESKIIESTKDYFRSKSTVMLQNSDLVSYLNLADTMLKAERTRFTQYLPWESVQHKVVHEF